MRDVIWRIGIKRRINKRKEGKKLKPGDKSR
jgi:hypothetical protein